MSRENVERMTVYNTEVRGQQLYREQCRARQHLSSSISKISYSTI